MFDDGDTQVYSLTKTGQDFLVDELDARLHKESDRIFQRCGACQMCRRKPCGVCLGCRNEETMTLGELPLCIRAQCINLKTDDKASAIGHGFPNTWKFALQARSNMKGCKDAQCLCLHSIAIGGFFKIIVPNKISIRCIKTAALQWATKDIRAVNKWIKDFAEHTLGYDMSLRRDVTVTSRTSRQRDICGNDANPPLNPDTRSMRCTLPVLPNKLVPGERVYACFSERLGYYWGQITSIHKEGRQTKYNISFCDGDRRDNGKSMWPTFFRKAGLTYLYQY